MTTRIPKEKLTAYQRWEVAAFDEAQRRPLAAAPTAAPSATASTPDSFAADAAAFVPAPAPAREIEPAIVLPTAEDIEAMHREAHEAGFAAGYQEGIAAAQAISADLARLLDGLQQAMATLDQQVADQLLVLAVEIAEQVLRQSLRVNPELLLPVVREAVTLLYPHQGQPLLFAHPDDAALVRSQLGEQLAHNKWRIVDDATLTRGGCRVEIGGSEVDATCETRWRRVIEAIGINQEWLEQRGSRVASNGQ